MTRGNGKTGTHPGDEQSSVNDIDRCVRERQSSGHIVLNERDILGDLVVATNPGGVDKGMTWKSARERLRGSRSKSSLGLDRDQVDPYEFYLRESSTHFDSPDAPHEEQDVIRPVYPPNDL